MILVKTNKVFSLVIIGLLLSLFSCDSANKSQVLSNEKYYFDLTGLVNKEIEILEKSKPYIIKVSRLDNDSEKIKTNSVDWKKELELFAKFDINRPAYKNSYTTSHIDSLTTEYTLLPSEKLLVKSLRIVYDDTRNVNHVQGKVFSENKLYESTQYFDLRFKNGHLTSYSLKGYQKLILMDKRPFDISVNIQ